MYWIKLIVLSSAVFGVALGVIPEDIPEGDGEGEEGASVSELSWYLYMILLKCEISGRCSGDN